MTYDEAKAIVDRCHAWIEWRGDELVLDGTFSLAEIEAIVVILKAGGSLDADRP